MECKRQKAQTSFKKRIEEDFVEIFQFPFHAFFESKKTGSLSKSRADCIVEDETLYSQSYYVEIILPIK